MFSVWVDSPFAMTSEILKAQVASFSMVDAMRASDCRNSSTPPNSPNRFLGLRREHDERDQTEHRNARRFFRRFMMFRWRPVCV